MAAIKLVLGYCYNNINRSGSIGINIDELHCVEFQQCKQVHIFAKHIGDLYCAVLYTSPTDVMCCHLQWRIFSNIFATIKSGL
jgi:hypothetical protein